MIDVGAEMENKKYNPSQIGTQHQCVFELNIAMIRGVDWNKLMNVKVEHY